MRHHCNYWGISKLLASAGRYSDHEKDISPFPCCLAAVCGPEELCGQSRHYAASGSTSKKHRSLTEVEHSPTQPVLRANSTRCFVRWQTIGPVRQAVFLSGSSLRKKS